MTARSPVKGNGVLVLGMHRSGTSAAAASLESLGLVMGGSLVDGDEWNSKGYFEEKRIVELNERLLEASGFHWDSPLPPGMAPRPEWADQVEPAAALLEEIFGHAAAWGCKDPRMCLLASFWRQVFASMRVAPRLLLVLRHPAEVAHSLARRDGISSRRAGWLWLTHLMGSLDYIEAGSDVRLVDFADLLATPEPLLRSLGEWLGLPCDSAAIGRFSSGFISARLVHGAAAGIEMAPLVLRAYAYWRNAAQRGIFHPSWLQADEWLDIRHEFERDIEPQLAAVHDFFGGDRQCSLAASRSRTTSQGLAIAERLALERLDQIHALSGQLKQTADALAFAEKLALQRQDELQALTRQCDALAAALSRAEQLVAEAALKSSELRARDARIEALEALAVQRLADVEVLDRELKTRSDRWARMEQSLRTREQTLVLEFARVEELAIERLRHIQALEQRLAQMAEALARAEQLAFERLTELERAAHGRC